MFDKIRKFAESATEKVTAYVKRNRAGEKGAWLPPRKDETTSHTINRCVSRLHMSGSEGSETPNTLE